MHQLRIQEQLWLSIMARKRLQALALPDGQLIRDPAQMIPALMEGWKLFFEEKVVDLAKAEEYLADKVPKDDLYPRAPSVRDFLRYIWRATEVSGGPDGFRKNFWAVAPDWSAELWYHGFAFLSTGDQIVGGFDDSIVAFIPKKERETDPREIVREIFELRTVNQKDVPPKAIAWVANPLLSPALQTHIIPIQRGFLRLRQSTHIFLCPPSLATSFQASFEILTRDFLGFIFCCDAFLDRLQK